ncbi:hypothetical protein JCM10212_000884 [Sporobolomyces blumeae]
MLRLRSTWPSSILRPSLVRSWSALPSVRPMPSPPPPPAFQSTQTVWPLQADQATTKLAASVPLSKSQKRNRKKAAAKASATAQAGGGAPDGAPPPSASTASTNKPAPTASRGASQPTQSQSSSRTSLPWRGSGRGRGRGGINAQRGGGGGVTQPGGVRSFSTAATSSNGADDTGAKVKRKPLFPSHDGGRRNVQSSATEGSTANGNGATANSASNPTASNRGQQRRGRGGGGGRGGRGGGAGRGRGQGKADANKGAELLNEVASRAGEADLEQQIHTLFEIQRPSPESVAARQHLIDELTDYLNREHFSWGHRHSSSAMPLKLEPFGSVRFGLGTSTSDLDLCLLDPYRPNGFEEKWYSSRKEHMQDLPDIYQMRKIGSSLWRAGLSNIHAIPDAAVPICKFEVEIDGHTIQADLNTNERLGLYNSRLLNSYCNLHPLVRPLSVFIKFWASQRGLNNPSGDADGVVTFSSYTLILLVVAYLQKIGILPNLQDETLIEQTGTERSRFFSTPKAYSRRGKLKHLIRSVGWDVTFVEYDEAPTGFEPTQATLVELARGFFQYFGEDFDLRNEVVSIANGKPFSRDRPFGFVPPRPEPRAPATTNGGAGEDEPLVEKAEAARQDLEDLALEAFAESEEDQHARQSADVDAIAEAQAELDEERATAEARREASSTTTRSRSDSRSSSPIPYGEFAEPEKWTEHLLVVQDPFILTRNCAGNVRPDWVEELRAQMRRARDLIDSSAPLSQICLHHRLDKEYEPVATRRSREKRKKEQEAFEKKRKEAQRKADEEKAKERARRAEEQIRLEEERKREDAEVGDELNGGGAAKVPTERSGGDGAGEPETANGETASQAEKAAESTEEKTEAAPAGQDACAEHHSKLPKMLVSQKSYHLAHHYKEPDMLYGVTSPFWDYVFSTGLANVGAKKTALGAASVKST